MRVIKLTIRKLNLWTNNTTLHLKVVVFITVDNHSIISIARYGQRVKKKCFLLDDKLILSYKLVRNYPEGLSTAEAEIFIDLTNVDIQKMFNN